MYIYVFPRCARALWSPNCSLQTVKIFLSYFSVFSCLSPGNSGWTIRLSAAISVLMRSARQHIDGTALTRCTKSSMLCICRRLWRCKRGAVVPWARQTPPYTTHALYSTGKHPQIVSIQRRCEHVRPRGSASASQGTNFALRREATAPHVLAIQNSFFSDFHQNVVTVVTKSFPAIVQATAAPLFMSRS